MEAHTRDLGTRGAMVDGKLADMILDLRVQPGGAATAEQLVQYGTRYNVTVKISEFP